MNVFDLNAKISLDSLGYEKGLRDAESKFNAFGDKMKAGLEKTAKAATAAVGAGAAAVGKIVSDAVGAYGSYEQLVGGVETLFGESAQKVLENSEKAFQTAGMSMNEYMETSIQSAASLINSLGGDQAKAAELMDMSITDMSDNVNKMGTTMEAVQNAYRGFSRQNFTMLDNLALGFAGTKEGMQELLDKAHEISGIEYDISSYSDIVQAIHVVQQEMGITGTTASEAADTIQGSVGSVKAAWENLKVELVREDGDIGKSIDTLVNSALTVFDNIEPKIERAVGGVATFVEKAAPIISEKLPPIIEKILPSLLQTGAVLVTSIGKGVAKAMPALLQSGKSIISDMVPGIEDALGINIDFSDAKGKIGGLVESIQGAIETVSPIAQGAVDLLKPLAEFTISEGASTVISMITTGFNGLSEAIEMLSPVFTPFWENVLKPLGEWTGGVVGEAIERMNQALEGLNIIIKSDGVGDLIVTLAQDFGKVGEKVGACTLAFGILKEGVKKFLAEAGMKLEVKLPILRGCFITLKDTVSDLNDVLLWMGGYVADCVRLGWDSITDGVNNFFDAVRLGWDSISDTVDKIISFAELAGGSVFDAFHDEEGNFKIPFRFAANGATLTNGQAIIAEAGPELLSVRNGVATVTPIGVNSSNSPVGGGMTVNINFGGVQVANDYDVDRMTDRAIQKLSEKLASLSVRQQRSVGGVGW